MLEMGSKTKVLKASKALMSYMDICEKLYLQKQELNVELDDFQTWFAELENSADGEDMDDWGDLSVMGFLN